MRPTVKRRRVGSALVGWGVALALLLAAVGAWLLVELQGEPTRALNPSRPCRSRPMRNFRPTIRPRPNPPRRKAHRWSKTRSPWARPRGSAEPAVELINDDGQTLWASPTSGPPIDIAHLPAGAEAVLVLRPAELVGSVEGAKMLEAIGPASATAAEAIHAITFCQWSEIEQLQIALYPVDAGPVRAAFVVLLAPSVTAEAWTERLSNRTPGEHAGKHYFQAGGWAYYLPESEAGRLVVVASAAQIDELIDAGAPRLTKEMERLLADTDAKRHFTLLGEPFSLFNGGQTIFVGQLQRLAEPLRRFLGDGVQAALVSAHVDGDLFLELRAYGQADKDPRQLAAHYRAELADLPGQFEAYLATLDPQPYGRALLQRFPKMLHRLQRFTRSGAEHHRPCCVAFCRQSPGTIC